MKKQVFLLIILIVDRRGLPSSLVDKKIWRLTMNDDYSKCV